MRLFEGDPLALRVLALRPAWVFACLSAGGLLLVLAPAALTGVTSVPGALRDVGLFHQANWWLMFPVILPAIFSIAGLLARRMVTALDDLCAAGVIQLAEVATTPDATSAALHALITEQLERTRRWISRGAIGLMIVLALIDISEIAGSYWAALHGATLSRPNDWTVAFAIPARAGWVPPSLAANGAAVLAAYAFQLYSGALGFYWLAKFWVFLHALSRVFRGAEDRFKLVLQVKDPLERFGLAPLGPLFNAFLFQTILFFGYVAAHRLQLIVGRGAASAFADGDRSWFGYVSRLFALSVAAIKNLKAGDLSLLREIFSAPMVSFGSCDPGMWILILALPLPVLVGTWFPVAAIARAVQARRDELIFASTKSLKAAREAGDQKLIEERLSEIASLRLTQTIWPNGERVAYTSFLLMAYLVVVAVVPPAGVFLGASGFLVWLLKYARDSIAPLRERGRRDP